MNKKGQEYGALSIFIIGILLILACSIPFFTGVHIITTENGRHTGTITAVETNGMIFKTISVYFKSDAQSSQEDVYCLIDKSLIPIIEQKAQDKAKVTLIYMDYFITSVAECGTYNGGIIVGIE
jgi:hypothetical protein